MGYSQSGAISALLTEKFNIKELINIHSNLLIRAAKSVNNRVIRVEALKYWQRLKIHGMSLVRYIDKGKMEMHCREIELSAGIQLKTRPRWLINKTRLKERLESENKRRSAIVIMVSNSEEALLLCSKELRFEGAIKVLEKYWEAWPGSVCMSCAVVCYDCLEDYGKRAMQCVICAGLHKVKNYKYGLTGCSIKVGKICKYIILKYASCGRNHQATAFRCPARLKAQAEAWKEKVKKSKAKDKQPATNRAFEEESAFGSSSIELNTEVISYARDLEREFSGLSLQGDNMPEDPQNDW